MPAGTVAAKTSPPVSIPPPSTAPWLGESPPCLASFSLISSPSLPFSPSSPSLLPVCLSAAVTGALRASYLAEIDSSGWGHGLLQQLAHCSLAGSRPCTAQPTARRHRHPPSVARPWRAAFTSGALGRGGARGPSHSRRRISLLDGWHVCCLLFYCSCGCHMQHRSSAQSSSACSYLPPASPLLLLPLPLTTATTGPPRQLMDHARIATARLPAPPPLPHRLCSP